MTPRKYSMTLKKLLPWVVAVIIVLIIEFLLDVFAVDDYLLEVVVGSAIAVLLLYSFFYLYDVYGAPDE